MEIAEFVRTTNLGRGLNDEESEKLAGIASEAVFSAGEKIFEQGDINDALYIVRSGAVEIDITTNEDMRLVVAMHPGDVFGDMAFIDTRSRSGGAKAVMDSQILVFSKDKYDKFAEEEHQTALKVMTNIARVMASRIRTMDR